MKIESENSPATEPATEADLLKIFNNDAARGNFIILSRDEVIFIQAAGIGDDPYSLECREPGDKVARSAGRDFTKADIIRAFRSYLAGDDLWKTQFDRLVIENHKVIPPHDKQRLYMTYNVLAKNEQDLKLIANLLDIKI